LVVKAFLLVLLLVIATGKPAVALELARPLAYGLQQSLNGLTVAATYCLLAVAYALLHGVTGRIVLSFGEVATFGAFATAYAMVLMIYQNLPPGLALIIVFAIGATAAVGIGHVVQRNVFSPLIKSTGQAIMIASIGVSIVIQEWLRIQTGARDQWLPPVFANPALHMELGGFAVTMTGIRVI
jgi:branched-subunit amino acid ABC-type transport system permease component